MITIDQAIKSLQDSKRQSPLRGETVLYLSLTKSGFDLVDIESCTLVSDGDGAVVEVRSKPWSQNDSH
jgi:hypothetical protein